MNMKVAYKLHWYICKYIPAILLYFDIIDKKASCTNQQPPGKIENYCLLDRMA
jgi:hypothetical protein